MKLWIPMVIAFCLLAVPAAPDRVSAESAHPDVAPDFQFLANDGHWSGLRDLRSRGHVLLVFEPGDDQLLALEREADSLRARGVIPIAVFSSRESENWSRIERLGLTYSLMSDPSGELAAQFQVAALPAEPSSATTPCSSAWCLVDRDGRVRGLERGGLPEAGFAGAVTLALEPREQAAAR